MVDPASRRLAKAVLLTLVLVLMRPLIAHADVVRGLMRVVSGVFELPKDVLVGTLGGPPIIGTVGGVVIGALRGTAMIVSGALEATLSAIPVAAKLAPYIPVFF